MMDMMVMQWKEGWMWENKVSHFLTMELVIEVQLVSFESPAGGMMDGSWDAEMVCAQGEFLLSITTSNSAELAYSFTLAFPGVLNWKW